MSREPVNPAAYAAAEKLFEAGRDMRAAGLIEEAEEVFKIAQRTWCIGLRGLARVIEIERRIGH